MGLDGNIVFCGNKVLCCEIVEEGDIVAGGEVESGGEITDAMKILRDVDERREFVTVHDISKMTV